MRMILLWINEQLTGQQVAKCISLHLKASDDLWEKKTMQNESTKEK